MKCPNPTCGAENPASSRFCTACGGALTAESGTPARYTPAGARDPNTAYILELVLGFFGLLGIGYLYVNRTQDGILRLVLWLVYNITAYVIITLLIAVIVGFVCIPFQLAIQIAVPIWSANELKKSLMR